MRPPVLPAKSCFNSQPPEGGWSISTKKAAQGGVSTHSRPKAAGRVNPIQHYQPAFQLTAARRRLVSARKIRKHYGVFQLTAARRRLETVDIGRNEYTGVSTHSRPKAAGRPQTRTWPVAQVSTHSRPKAAGSRRQPPRRLYFCFNSQPPEGGWRQQMGAAQIG